MKMLELIKKNKPHPLLEKVRFEEICEGECIQMLHLGSYDSEPASFRQMEQYDEHLNFKRTAKTHREMYLSDARKVPADKLKKVLRFQVTKE